MSSHSEQDIPECIEQARKKHPRVSIVYAWPFDLDLLAGMFSRQIGRFETAGFEHAGGGDTP